jgi:hypothetical protein
MTSQLATQRSTGSAGWTDMAMFGFVLERPS